MKKKVKEKGRPVENNPLQNSPRRLLLALVTTLEIRDELREGIASKGGRGGGGTAGERAAEERAPMLRGILVFDDGASIEKEKAELVLLALPPLLKAAPAPPLVEQLQQPSIIEMVSGKQTERERER